MNTNDPAHAPTGEWKAEDAQSALTERDLLFGRLSVLNGFVDDKTIETAGRQVDASKTLADVLVAFGAITEEIQQTIQQLLELHISAHGEDPQQSLERLSAVTKSFVDSPEAETVAFAPVAKNATSASRLFGDYEIIEPIAEGGMGVVYKARQAKLNRIVALKMIRSGELPDKNQIERFYSEAQAAAKLDHPGIVPVHEVGQQNGQHFFSMAFVDGASLHDKVKDAGPLPPKRAAALMKTITEAVQFGHDEGIVHRDIKPHNILLDKTASPRVTDFGLARHGDSEMTVAGQVMGTPSYMPPEQAEGKQDEIGAVSDVYSLGATLYYLLTGRPPFQAANPTDTLRQVVNNEPVSPRNLNPDIHRDLETICLKCMRKERTGRYATAQDLADDLSRWLENKPIVARRVGVVGKSWLWCKRKPALAGSLAALVVVIVAGSLFAQGIIRERDRQAEQDKNATKAKGLVDSLANAEIVQVPQIVQDIDDYRIWADPLLKEKLANAQDGSPEKLRLSLSLLPVDGDQVPYLQIALLNADAPSLPVIRDALISHRSDVTAVLWTTLASKEESASQRFNAACALATFDTDNTKQWQPVLSFVADQLVETLTRSPRDFAVVLQSLEPIRKRLAGPVAAIVRDTKRGELQRETALNVVLEYAGDDARQLADVLAYSEQRQFGKTFDKLTTQKTAALPHLTAILKEAWTDTAPESEKERIAKRQANAAVALLKLGETIPVWPLLKHSPDLRARSYFIHWAAPLGVDPQLFLKRFETEPDTSIRRALLLTLGEYNEHQLPVARRQPLLKTLLTVYETDPDPGLHGCAAWLLRMWGQKRSVREINKKLQSNEEQRKAQMKDGKRRWYVNTQRQTFAVLTADVFRMGSPESEADRNAVREVPHLRKIGRTFAIATHEVTKAQFRRFQFRDRTIKRYNIDRYSPTADSPQVALDWYDAAAYCNWLSKLEGIPEDQWCYQKNTEGKYAAGMRAKPNYLELTGYRLPTEAEWEYACRAGTTTSRYYGATETLLTQYARHAANGEKHAWSVGGLKPNGFGLFDMLGNAYEWCHDGFAAYTVTNPKQATSEFVDIRPVSDTGTRLLRGGSCTGQPSYVRSALRFSDRPRGVRGDGVTE
eukprot:g22054.t1